VRQYFYGDPRRSIANMMRELHTIDHQICSTTLEAEITELRLIHAHRPRYNRRSRPPKTSHFVKLTKEAFPRLSVVRTLRDGSLLYLGPFGSKRAADLVMTALWDSIPIRRCRTRPGSRGGKCAPAQLGVASCPCDGTMTQADYQPIVDRLIDGATVNPSLLLEPLVAKMSDLADGQRYEEAGWTRDRHDALARAIERRQTWGALQGLGWWEAETDDGAKVVIDHGRLVSTWRTGEPAPLMPVAPESHQVTEVPQNVEGANEADLLWKWLVADSPRITNSTGLLALPIHRPKRLTQKARGR
jgi:DNA polymerase-3 subunit epsilon